MSGNFLDFMKGIGIFILCAQSFMHFAAGKTYEKYVKLLIGVMILAQFIVPVRALFLGSENAQMWDEIEHFREEMERMAEEAGQDAAAAMEQGGADPGAAGMYPGGADRGGGRAKSAVEEEMKGRIAEVAGSCGWVAQEVELSQEPPRIMIKVRREGNGEEERKKIKIDKIAAGTGMGQDIEDLPEYQEERLGDLREAFAKAIGVDADYVEVVAEEGKNR